MIAVQAGGFQSNPQNPGLKKKRQMWWHMLVLPALVRQWQLDFRELWDRKTSLIDELQATGRLYIYIDLHQEQHLRLLLATTCKHTCTPHVHILIYTCTYIPYRFTKHWWEGMNAAGKSIACSRIHTVKMTILTRKIYICGSILIKMLITFLAEMDKQSYLSDRCRTVNVIMRHVGVAEATPTSMHRANLQ